MTHQTTFLVTELKDSKPTAVSIELTLEQMSGIAGDLGLEGLSKTRFEGQIEPYGRKNWRLVGKFGASPVQACVVTLNPVKTRLDLDVERIYLADYEAPEEDSVTEMAENDDISEPLGDEIDLLAVIAELIALNIPAYPRAQDAKLENQLFAAPGVEPLTDQELKPFASLAELKEKLEKGGE